MLIYCDRQWAAVDQFIAAGASYGGIVSLEYILAHPDRVTCLLLRNTVAAGLHLTLGGFRALLTSPRVKADHDLLERVWSGNARDAEELIEVLGDLGTLFKPEFTANGERREPPPRGQMSPEKLNVDVWNCSASYNIPRYDVRSRLPSIGVPTMVVGGTQDIITTVRHVEEIAEGIPKAELFILEGAGHNLPDDERELWNQTVWNFLKTQQFCD
jgi:proline iminopeptidase